MLYDNRPETLAYAYRFDPRVAEISSSLASVVAEFLRRLREHPVDYLGWYLFGKPTFLFSWDLFEGVGDIYIYPVLRTPYGTLRLFTATHALMHVLHNALVILAILGSIGAWLPRSWVHLSEEQCFMARTVAALMAYFVVLHSILNPLARYSIPMRPVIYAMAMFALWYAGRGLWKWIAARLDGKRIRRSGRPAPPGVIDGSNFAFRRLGARGGV